MKTVVLSGLGTEQLFSGKVQYTLIFNDGELRIPCTEEAAESIIKYMTVPEESASSRIPVEEYDSSEGAEEAEDNDTQDNARYLQPRQTSVDEDGIQQI